MPFWVICLSILGLFLLASKAGGAAGLKLTQSASSNDDDTVNGVVLPAILGLLGLLIGFTFSFALTWENNRKISIQEEILAIGTAFNMADLLEAPDGRLLQSALLDLARAESAWATSTDLQTKTTAQQLAKNEVWETARLVLGPGVPSPIRAAVAESLNDAMDASDRRHRAMNEHISYYAGAIIVFITTISLFASAMRETSTGRALTWMRFPAIGIFWLTMVLVLDVGRPVEGFIRIDTSGVDRLVLNLEQTLVSRAAQ